MPAISTCSTLVGDGGGSGGQGSRNGGRRGGIRRRVDWRGGE